MSEKISLDSSDMASFIISPYTWDMNVLYIQNEIQVN